MLAATCNADDKSIKTLPEGGNGATSSLVKGPVVTDPDTHRNPWVLFLTDKMCEPSQGPWYYQQITLGYNSRMTDIQAALGLSLMQRLDAFDSHSAWHLYVIRVNKRHQVFDSLRQAGIGVNVHYIPVQTQPYYRKMGFKLGDFLEAEKYYTEAITLPLYPQLTKEKQDKVIVTLKKV